MKKIALSITAIATILAVSFTSCKKDNTTAPVVTLVGAASMEVDLGTTWVDPGATATDDKDGTITPTVSGTVNTDLVGEYTLTYKATDGAGNESTATRVVKVKANKIIGTYTVVETYSTGAPYTYSQVIIMSADPVGYNKLSFVEFGDYGTNATTVGTVVGNNVTLAEKSYTATANGVTGTNRIYDITGTIEKNGTNYNVKTMSYKTTWTPNGGTAVTTTITQNYTRI